jgi:hypothetical protein
LLAGRLPFVGDLMAVLSQVLLDEPPPPSKFRPSIDPELEAICKKAMAKKIEDRFGSMKEMALALQEYLRGETQVTPPRLPTTITQIPTAEAVPSTPGIRVSALGGMRSMEQVYAEIPKRATPSPLRRPKRSRPKRGWGLWAGLLLFAALLGVLIVAAGGLALYHTWQQSLTEEFGTIRLELIPADAAVKVEIDGVPDHHHGDMLRLRPGAHRLTIYGKDWQAVHQGFPVNAGENSPLRITLVKAISPAVQAEEVRHVRWEGGPSVYMAALSSDGSQCLVTGDPDTARLYDVKTGKVIHKLPGVVALFKPDGKEIVTASRVKGQAMIRVYSRATGTLMREFEIADDLWNLRLSPAGDCALVVAPTGYRLVNLETKQTVKQIACDIKPSTAFFAPDGKYLLLLAGGKAPWQVFDCASTKTAADFAKLNPSPPKAQLYKNIVSKPKLDGFFADSRRVFFRTDNQLHVIDVATGTESSKITLGPDVPTDFVLGPGGTRALASYNDHTMRLWELAGQRELCRFPTALESVKMLTFSSDGHYAAAVGPPAALYVWRLPEIAK